MYGYIVEWLGLIEFRCCFDWVGVRWNGHVRYPFDFFAKAKKSFPLPLDFARDRGKGKETVVYIAYCV